MIEFKISGFPELQRDFTALDFSKRERVLIRAAKTAAEPIRHRASELAPVLTGWLSRNQIISGAGQRNDAYSVTMLIGPSSKAFYGLYQELGTIHQSPQPFLEPAFIQAEEAALKQMAGILNEEIQKALAA